MKHLCQVRPGQVFVDRDSRMGGRQVKVVEVFYNKRKKGRLYGDTHYARCSRVTTFNPDSEANLVISCARLLSSAYRLVSEIGSLVRSAE